MCVLSAGGRAAIFLKNFILSNGVFESKRICSCLWGITFYWFPIPKLDLVRLQTLKTSNKNNYNITAYATKKKKIECKPITSLFYTLYFSSEHEMGWELCWFPTQLSAAELAIGQGRAPGALEELGLGGCFYCHWWSDSESVELPCKAGGRCL